MRYVFIINPIAGKGKMQKQILNKINSFFFEKNLDYKIYFSKEKGDAMRFANEEAMCGEQITFFACGGEGTEFEVLNGIFGYDNATLGIIPCGSANDFLKFFKNKEAFLNIDDQISGEPIFVDLIKADNYYCLNGCSVGMDAMVGKEMIHYKKLPFVNGSLAYKLGILKVFFSKIGVKIGIKLDGTNLGIKNCLFAVIANAPFYGGGFKGAPNAVPFDGKLDFTLVDTISRLKILKFLPIYEQGKHENLECCTLKNCNSLEISSDIMLPINLDGEIFFKNRMNFSIVKKGIKLLLPKSIVTNLLIKS